MRCHVPKRPEVDCVEVQIAFAREDLSWVETPFGLLLELTGTTTSGEPGAPALPYVQARIAVPARHWPAELTIVEERWQVVHEGPVLVAPGQPSFAVGSREQSFEPYPSPPIAPPDPEAYELAATRPAPAVVAKAIDDRGLMHLAVVGINPVRITKARGLELLVEVRLRVAYTREAPVADRDAAAREISALVGRTIRPEQLVPQPSHVVASQHEAVEMHARVLSEVSNPSHISPLVDVMNPDSGETVEYLIVTDDVTWDHEKIQPNSASPGVVAAFERLVRWKQTRGLSARLVRITDIVAGAYGDFRTGSRDLQEVIRKFLKFARGRWATRWLLLGGDASIVPTRLVAGAVKGRIEPGDEPTPGKNRSFWNGDHLRVCIDTDFGSDPGLDWQLSYQPKILLNEVTGQLIPFDPYADGHNSTTPAWFFTTDDTYEVASDQRTPFLRVQGPEALVHARLQVVIKGNQIPTDFYYSSLESWVAASVLGFQLPYTYAPEHDWDAIGNGVYGQHTAAGKDRDGVILKASISVGRAPVRSAADAEAFVGKVLAYEGYATSSGQHLPLSGDWPRRLLFVSANFFEDEAQVSYEGLPEGDAPERGTFRNADTHTLLHLHEVPATLDWRLVANISSHDPVVIPPKQSTSPSTYGWYFARSASNHSRSSTPSQWIIVHKPGATYFPSRYDLESMLPDWSMTDQERLREQMHAHFPGLDHVDRLYEDPLDLTPLARAQAPVKRLTQSRLVAALNAAPHLVVLAAHGSATGIGLERQFFGASHVRDLANGKRGFIAYAFSCHTAATDDESFGEVLIKNPDGGAVAYVGHSRITWADTGARFARAFFRRLRTTRHLGLLNDNKVTEFGAVAHQGADERWNIFALHLFGCPEMQVYREPIRPLADPGLEP